MNQLARWSLKVSRETDIALRTHLARRGGKKGDLSRFVEQAVARAMLRETVNEIREGNAHLDPEEIQELVDDGVAEVRRLNPDRFAPPRLCVSQPALGSATAPLCRDVGRARPSTGSGDPPAGRAPCQGRSLPRSDLRDAGHPVPLSSGASLRATTRRAR